MNYIEEDPASHDVNYDEVEDNSFYYFVDHLGHEESGYENYPVKFGTERNRDEALLIAEFVDETNAEEYTFWKNDSLNYDSTFPHLADIEDVSAEDEPEYVDSDAN